LSLNLSFDICDLFGWNDIVCKWRCHGPKWVTLASLGYPG
jgi:hypothetical protein